MCRPRCRKEQSRRLHSFGGTAPVAPCAPEGEAKLSAWLRANRVDRAVMEASGGYQRSWAEALRAAGIEVLIVDPKRIRHFAEAAGAPGQERSNRRRDDRLVRRDLSRSRRSNQRSRARRGRPAGPGPGGRERGGRANQATGRASPAGPRRQGPRRDRQGGAGRAAQARRRDRRQDQREPSLRDHPQRAGARPASGRRRDRLVSRARAYP